MSDINPRDLKSVRLTAEGDYKHIEISVNPASTASGKFLFHSVGIMDTHQGQGQRAGIEQAEAEAKAVLKAIRKYRKQNPEVFG